MANILSSELRVFTNKTSLMTTDQTVQYVNTSINELSDTIKIDYAKLSALDEYIKKSELNTSTLSANIDYLLFASDSISKIIWAQDIVYYVDDDQTITQYESIYDALNSEQLSNFNGYIQIAEDLTLTGSPIIFHQNLVIDGRGHKININRATFCQLSSNENIDPTFTNPPNITIRNCEFYSLVKNGYQGNKFIVTHGNLKFEDVKITIDCGDDTLGNNYIVRMEGSTSRNYIVPNNLYVDKNCVFSMINQQKSNIIFSLFSSYFRLNNKSQLTSTNKYQEYLDLLNGREAYSTIELDGKIVMTTINSDVQPDLVATNGSDIYKSYFILDDNAYINQPNGLGIYIGSYTHVILKGGTLIAGTPICMRGGILEIPKNSNVNLIAVGKKQSYTPYHTIYGGGSDAGSNLHLGHAILLENNGRYSYGNNGISAIIDGGKFVSYHNSPIGSYGIALTSLTQYNPNTDLTLSSNGYVITADYYGNNIGTVDPSTITSNVTGTYAFLKRIENFVNCGEMNNIPSENEYEPLSGLNADYNVLNISSYIGPMYSIHF